MRLKATDSLGDDEFFPRGQGNDAGIPVNIGRAPDSERSNWLGGV
jgi:hypothetical protein